MAAAGGDAAAGGVDLERALQVATDAARAAGALIVKTFNEPKNVQHKGKVDLVSSPSDPDIEPALFWCPSWAEQ